MYQVWTKAEYEDNWKLTECPDIAAVEDIIRANFGKEVAVKVSTPVGFDAKIAVEVHAPPERPKPAEKPAEKPFVIIEGEINETAQSKAQPDKGAGSKGHGKVR